jgi:hypothetical protein
MQEGLQLPELLAKIKVLREAELRAEQLHEAKGAAADGPRHPGVRVHW